MAKNKKNRSVMANKNLPDEMIMEILSRLPIEYHSGFRGVSRSWCEKIMSDRMLVPKSKGRNRIARLDPETNKLYLGREVEVEVECDGEKKRWTHSWEEKDVNSLLPPMIDGGGTGIVRLLASFDDLLLLSHGKHLLLLNPSIGRCRKVFDYPPLMERGKFVSGICYDSYSHDYKVLIGRNYCFCDDPGFVVISLKTKALKPVRFPYKTCAIGPMLNGLVVDEKIHFREFGSGVKIIYFDVIREEFMELSIPGVTDAERIPRLGFTLGILDGCLAVCRNRYSDNFPYIKSQGFADIWVMRKHGVQESWMIFFTISRKINPDLTYIFRPLFVTKDGGGFCVIDNRGITLFNLKDKNNSDVVGVPCFNLSGNCVQDHSSTLKGNSLEDNLLQTVVAYNGGTSFPLDRDL